MIVTQGSLPNNWMSAKLGDVCEVITGSTPSKSDASNYGSDIPFIKPPNLQHSKIGTTEEMLSLIGGAKSRLVPENSVLVTCIGNLGRTGITNRLSGFNQQINAILENSNLTGKFLFYQAQSPSFKLQLEALAAATTVTIVNKGKFETISINIPPLAEQHRIVAKIEELFSELDKGVETLKTAQEQLKVYRQAVLKYAFEGKLTEKWRENYQYLCNKEALENIINEARDSFYNKQLADWEDEFKNWDRSKSASIKPSKPTQLAIPDLPSVDHLDRKWNVPNEWLWTQMGTICFVTKLAGFEYTEYVKYDLHGDLPVLKAENAGVNGFKRTEYSKVHSVSVQMLKRSILNGGELLIAFVGSVGNVATVPNDQKYFLGPNIGMARPYLNLNAKFLEYQLRSPLGRNMLLASVKAVTQPSLSMGTIRQTPIVLTSLEEQQQVVLEIEARLSVCDKIEESIVQGLQQAEALRQSILKKAFEGKLVPQDPNDESASVLLERIKAERNSASPVKKTKTKKTKV